MDQRLPQTYQLSIKNDLGSKRVDAKDIIISEANKIFLKNFDEAFSLSSSENDKKFDDVYTESSFEYRKNKFPNLDIVIKNKKGLLYTPITKPLSKSKKKKIVHKEYILKPFIYSFVDNYYKCIPINEVDPPIKVITYRDFCLPLDKNFLHPKYEHHLNIFQSEQYNKRVTYIEYNKNKKQLRIDFEKCINTTHDIAKNMDYYIGWLMSVGHKKAKQLAIHLIAACNDYADSLRTNEIYAQQMQNIDKAIGKIYLQKLSQKTKGFLQLHPVFCRIKKASLSEKWTSFRETYNYKAIEETGIKIDQLDLKNSFLSMKEYMRCNSWIDFILSEKTPNMSFKEMCYEGVECPVSVYSRGMFLIQNNQHEVVPGFCATWMESWIQGDYLFKKSYGVYLMDSLEEQRRDYCKNYV